MKITTPESFWSRVVPMPTGCWEWQGSLNHARGYGRLSVAGRRILAHRYVWEALYGAVPDEMRVLHRCDNPPCVRPAHLFLGTMSDNAWDRERKGRRNARGTRNGRAKLTDDDIIAIRLARASGQSNRRQARSYGVTPYTIRAVLTGKTWRHVS